MKKVISCCFNKTELQMRAINKNRQISKSNEKPRRYVFKHAKIAAWHRYFHIIRCLFLINSTIKCLKVILFHIGIKIPFLTKDFLEKGFKFGIVINRGNISAPLEVGDIEILSFSLSRKWKRITYT